MKRTYLTMMTSSEIQTIPRLYPNLCPLPLKRKTPEQEHEDEDVDLNKLAKRKRDKRLSPGTCKQNESKEKRVKGMPHKNKGGQEICAKAMGPPCNSKFCQRVSTQYCQVITEEQRQWIFQKIWAMNTWEECKLYVTEPLQTGWTKMPSTVMNKRQRHRLNLDLRMASKQSLKLMSRISLRTGWGTCPLLIHTTAEAQRPIKTRSSFTQAQTSPNYSRNINRQLQLLEWSLFEYNISQMCSMKRTILYSFCENTSVMFLFHSSMGISVRKVHNFTLFNLRSKEGYCYIWRPTWVARYLYTFNITILKVWSKTIQSSGRS